VQAGGLEPDAAKRLEEAADRNPSRASAVLREARVLREAIFSVFSAGIQDLSPSSGELEILNGSLPPALQNLRLVNSESIWDWGWEDGVSLDRVLWPIVVSAAGLLTSDRLSRVRRCAAEDCDWLFLDESRNRSRRWCDMTLCGNRNKVRRFRETRRED